MLFWRNPNRGLRTAEIAGYLGVTERTARNYLNEFTASGRLPLYKDGWEWRLVEGSQMDLLPVNLDLEQGAQLYLAARLLAKHSDEPDPTIRAALVKLISAMPETLTGHLERLAQGLPTRADSEYASTFRAIVYGWATRRVVELEYQPLNARPYRARFHPYLLEPSAIGYTIYAIGHSDPPSALRTYKLERISGAEMTDEPFELPAEFDGLDLLQRAWGVMYGEELQSVVLRFAAGTAARRVKETIWHPSQQTRELDDGRVEWSAQVGDWLEMLPWIRGWGADVEVMGPDELREVLVGETSRLAALYEIKPIAAYQMLWAKTSKDNTQTHALICHMIDVAQVALTLWDEVLTEGMRQQFATTLSLDAEAAGRLIAFWAGLHDLGKASPCFQRKYKPAVSMLSHAGLEFPRHFTEETCYHGTISGEALAEHLEHETGLPSGVARQVARAVGGHHGTWPHPSELQALRLSQMGGDGWVNVRRELVHALIALLAPPIVEELNGTQQEQGALVTLLSGLTSTADWIGSMDRYFPYVPGPIDEHRYALRAEDQAHRALSTLGWVGWQPPRDLLSFENLFGFGPRPMQETVMDLAKHLDQPALVIVEAPTGIGKTEAALYLADHWARVLQQRGLYVAMPTMATSNQMFGRVRHFLANRYPTDLVNLQLIHSQAGWREDMQDLRLETADERQGGTVAAMAWFLPRKRSLLAPFGVGTVDQGLLSVLQTRHFFVRLFGLSHKTIIFDEVHAYDAYMSTIFQRLLAWLRSVGASVVILSATLPATTRRNLLQAYTGTPDAPLPEVHYPSITWATEGEVGVEPLGSADSRTVDLTWIEHNPESMATRLRHELRDGGCAAVICNTVARAQQVYQELKAADIVPGEDLILFHARFPMTWRDEIEGKVLERFGKGGSRPGKAIVVATQVIEQSLDLDFDLMATDLAPVDLILQRAGRLHRHERSLRPAPLVKPRLLITTPPVQHGAPDFGPDTWVYEHHVLLRSYLTMQGLTRMVLPADTEGLIEAVYGEEWQPPGDLPSSMKENLERARQKMERSREEEQGQARDRLVPEPWNRRLMSLCRGMLEEDRPELHEAFQALTRLSPPSVSVVCLHETEAGLALEPDGRGPIIDLTRDPGPDLTQQLAMRSVGVSHRRVVSHLLAEEAPMGWREHPLLRHYRVAVFAQGVCSPSGIPYQLLLDRELGLQIHKEVQ